MRRRAEDQQGFTFIELLVVIIIIAILAAIAIPVFFRQRDKALVAQSESALANARLFAEGYSAGPGDGSYLDLTPSVLEDEGYRPPGEVELLVPFPDDDTYCIVAVNFALPAGHEWQTAMISSESGTALPDGDCTEPDPEP